MKKTSGSFRLLTRVIGVGILMMASSLTPAQPQQVSASGQESETAGGRMLESNEWGALIEFSAPEYTIEKENINGSIFHKIRIPGTTATVEEGQPELPVIGILLGIPAAAELEIELVMDEQQSIEGIYRLVPADAPTPIQDELMPGYLAPKLPGDDGSLSQPEAPKGRYPAQPARLGEIAWMRDQRIVQLFYYPFQIEPATGKLTWHRTLRVRVNFLGGSFDPAAKPAEAMDHPFEQVLRQNLLNYDSALAWRSSLGPISPNGLSGTSTLATQITSTSAQTRYRIAVTKDDLYRLTYENLKSAGVPVDPLDLSALRLTNQGREATFFFDDRDDNQVFGPGDSLIFYGQKFSGDWMAARYLNENAAWLTYSIQLADGSFSTWKPAMNADMLEKYTDENSYWLEIGAQPQAPIQPVNSPTKLASGAVEAPSNGGMAVYLPTILRNSELASYRETIHAEESNWSRVLLFSGEDTWYWDEIKTSASSGTTRTYSLSLTAPVPGSYTANISGELVAAAYNDSTGPDHHIQIFINDPQHHQPVLDATWDGKSRFHFDADFPQSRLVDGANQVDLVVFKTPALAVETIYLDWLQVGYNRRFLAQDNRLEFSSSQTGYQSYRVSGFTANDVQVYDITDPLIPVLVADMDYGGGLLRFRVNPQAAARYFTGEAAVLPAGDISAYTPVDVSQPADYIFITHRDFLASLQPLVDWREAQGFTTKVIDVGELYNQFNDGIYNPIAIKNFLAYTFQNWSQPPAYVVLVGDGHYNFKGSPKYDSPTIYMPPFLNWVDPWQGEVDSANLLATVVGSDPIPDVAIGRIPVNSVQQLSNVITKTIAYEQSAAQDWKKHILFIADNTPDPAGDFVASSEQMIAGYVPAGYTSDRRYLDDFTDNGTCNPPPPGDPRTCPAATQSILDYFNQQGAFLVNYTGHASLNLWTSEQIFTNQDLSLLSNGSKLPIVLSMTCLDGYWMHPNQTYASQSGPALAEELVRAQESGAVATFSPTGLGVASGHELLQKGFYEAVFQNGATRLGEATLAAKLRLFASGYHFDLLHTFTMFGDPGLIFPAQ